MDLDSYSEKIEDLKATLRKRREIFRLSFLENTLRALRPGERMVLYALALALSASTFVLLVGMNAAVSVIVPAHEGSLTEGVVGGARFINPLLALSEPDKDLSALVYSGLMRATPEGSLIPDLAEKYEISGDGTTYTFTLRPGLTFHDGAPVSSEDILFTIQRAQNPDIKSTRRADWEGVVASAPDSRTVTFTLPHAYAPFLENTTLGILPKHLWEDVPLEEFPFAPFNTRPVGSGPYRVLELDTNASGAATRYELVSFSEFALGRAFIKKITFLFYPNEEALVSAYNAGRIDGFAGISPSEILKITRADAHVVHVPLPRTFAVFFNQNKNTALADAAVRSALDIAIDKESIVDEILKGYGVALEGPIPPGVLGVVQAATPELLKNEKPETGKNDNAEQAKAALSRGGWTFLPAARLPERGQATSTAQAGDHTAGVWTKKKMILEFTLATADEPELAETARALARAWQEAGIKVEIHVYPLSELNTSVLRPRNYEAALFGEVVGRTLDLFAFWHSSQRNDPGLNLALYTNTKVDTILARARTTTSKQEREKLYGQFVENVVKDKPAVFLYAPEFIYVVPETVQGIELGALTQPAERFLNVHQWYTSTERVWNIFTNQSQ